MGNRPDVRHFQFRLHGDKVSGTPAEYLEREAIKVLDWCRANLRDKDGSIMSDRDLGVLLLIEFGKQLDAGWKPERGGESKLLHQMTGLVEALSRQAARFENINPDLLTQSGFDRLGYEKDAVEISTYLSTENLTSQSMKFVLEDDE